MSSSDLNQQTTISGSHTEDLFLGRVIDGKYKVLSKIGSGGMGAVYKAEHSLMGRMVAIKILHPHLVENEDLLKRFQHEARTASRLRHPNAITTFDFGIFEDSPFIVMEFVEGRTLKQLISSSGPLPFRRVRDIFLQVGAALAQAHQLGIVHRDLKPDNIMLVPQSDGTESAVVLDFGIAKTLSQGGEHRTVLTQSGTFFGTPKYASPEQVSEKSIDGRSDIYTLGIIFYEALCGEVPFDAPSMMEILIKQINEEPVPLRRFKPALRISEEVDELVMRCLRKRADERFQNLGELIEALREVKESQFRGKLLAGIGVSAVLLLAGSAWWLTREPAPGRKLKEQRKLALSAQVVTPIPTPLQGATAKKQPSAITEANLLATAKEGQEQAQSVLSAFGSMQRFFGVSSSDAPPREAAQPIVEQVIPPVLKQNEEQVLEELTAVATPVPTPVPVSDSRLLANLETELPPKVSVAPPVNLGAVTPVPTALPTLAPGPGAEVLGTSLLRKELENVEAGKKEAIALYNQGRKLYEQQRYGEAVIKFEQAVQLRSDAVASIISLGNCYLRLQRTEQARQAFLKAVQVAPSYGPAHYNLAAFYALNGETLSALQSLRKSISLDPRARRVAADEPDFRSLRSIPEFKRLVE